MAGTRYANGRVNGRRRFKLVHQLAGVVLGSRLFSSGGRSPGSPHNPAPSPIRPPREPSTGSPPARLARPGKPTRFGGPPAGSVEQLGDLCLVFDRAFQALADEVPRGQHPSLVRGVRIRLGKDGKAVSQSHVGRAVPGLGGIGCPLVMVAIEIPVVERFQLRIASRMPRRAPGKTSCA